MDYIIRKISALLESLLNRFFPEGDVGRTKSVLQVVGLSGVIFLSLIVSGFVGIFNSYALFAIPLCLMTMVYLSNLLISKEGDRLVVDIKGALQFQKKNCPEYLWLLALFATAMGFIKGSWGMGNLIDLIVIGCCILIILDVPQTTTPYQIGLKLFAAASLFYACSVWVQLLFPELYKTYLGSITNGSNEKIAGFSSYLTGFTTSPGHTANYLAIGLFSFSLRVRVKRVQAPIAIGFLLISMMLIGMRMPLISTCVAMLLVALIYLPRQKRKKLCVVLLVCIVITITVLLLFQDQLRNVPVFDRAFIAIENLLDGKAMDSSRSKLHNHAINLFKRNPLFGIGWGEYRKTVVGTVTLETEFDAHNIFLQLLCEIGMVGLLLFLIPMGYTLVKTIRCFAAASVSSPDGFWTKLLAFSAMVQIQFLIFGLTDNPLYYPNMQISYLICCSILIAYLKETDKKCISLQGQRRIKKKRGGCA